MSFTQSFVGKVLLYLDILACSIVRRDPGVTISAECDIALTFPKPGAGQALLRGLGRVLNTLQRGHTRAAAEGDAQRNLDSYYRLNTYLNDVEHARK